MQARILNIGSLNIDHVYRVKGFVRPGETAEALSYARHAGGKGFNQSVALARAGAAVSHAGLIGEDGLWLRDYLDREGVETSRLRVTDAPTGHAFIQVDEKSGQNCILLHGGANRRFDAGAAAIRALFDGTDGKSGIPDPFGPGDWLLLQHETNALPEILREAGRRGMRVAFNPAPMTEAVPSYPLEIVTYFILNEGEALALAGLDPDGFETASPDPAALETAHPDKDRQEQGHPKKGPLEQTRLEQTRLEQARLEQARLDQAMEALNRRFPRADILFTLGAEGAWQKGPAGEFRVPAEKVQAVDTTAAGDTFLGYMLAGLAAGMGPEPALRRACRAAALGVTRPGAADSIPRLHEVA